MRHKSKSAEIRSQLTHPVIDSDGHILEMNPVFNDYLKAEAGAGAAERYQRALQDSFIDPRWRTFSMEERRARRGIKPTWWAVPAKNTLDLATAMLPKLMYERLDEMGLDFSVIYPTLGLITIGLDDDELRRASARALNRMKAEMFAEFADRLTPAAVIPMHTPQEAIEELEFAARSGIKVVMMASYVKRPIARVAREYPGAARFAYWMDTFGLDSEYDYDPVWAKCTELGIAPTFHSVGYGWGSRLSISNYVHNHLGNFAASADAICRGLFMGGVPKRFPKLRFGFLEGGVSWARTLLCELAGHWEKRNRDALENYNPARADRELLRAMMERYGGKQTEGRVQQIIDMLLGMQAGGADPALLDEFAPSGVKCMDDIRELFVERFYFGCEGDDPLNTLAFKPQGTPFDAKLNAFYGSDIGHWDVPDMKRVLEEAYELVAHGLIADEDLRDFMFANPVRFWTANNPDFFKGTVVEQATRSVIA